MNTNKPLPAPPPAPPADTRRYDSLLSNILQTAVLLGIAVVVASLALLLVLKL